MVGEGICRGGGSRRLTQISKSSFRMSSLTCFLSRGTISPFPLPFRGTTLTFFAVSKDDALIGQNNLGIMNLTHFGVTDKGVELTTPCGDQKAQGMSSEEQDAIDERPFFALDPVLVTMIVRVIQNGIERCGSQLSVPLDWHNEGSK